MVRHRHVGREPGRRGGGLSEISVPRDLLRPVVERTLAMVRAEAKAKPSRAAPLAIGRLLRFRQLPPIGVDTVVVALENDPDLRARVQATTTEREVGRVGWLWLARPDGWDTELRGALGDLAADDGAPSIDTVGSDAQLKRRLAGAERAVARSRESITRLEADNARLCAEGVALRAERDTLAGGTQAMKADADHASTERARAVGDLKRIEKLLARRDEERRALQQRVDELQAASAQPRPTSAVESIAGPTGSNAAIAGLATLADRIERALGDAAIDLDALRVAVGLTVGASVPVEDVPVIAPARAAKPTPTPRRRARRMPRGLVDDTVEGAAWLLTERPMLLVDGYNVSMTAWPDADIAAQRQRLVRLLSDLAARSPGLGVEVVFDGDSIEGTPAALPARTGVNVRFTPPDVEADDELLAMIGRFPVARAVVVASTDQRVRDGARRRGANVMSAHQLLAVARS